jgi:hypothetical protein
MKLSTKLKIGAATVALAAVAATGAQAFTLAGNTVDVAFVDPFNITYDTAADFGDLVAGVNTTYEMLPDNTVNPGPGGAVVGGTQQAGVFEVSDSGGTGVVDITVNNQVAGTYMTIDEFNCDYNTGTAANGVSCLFDGVANPAAGTPLLVGFDITIAGSPAGGSSDAATFDVSVVYD